MNRQIPLTASSIADRPHFEDGTNEIADDLAYRRIAMVNVVFYGEPGCGDGRWVLIDTGLPGFARRIQKAAHGTGSTLDRHRVFRRQVRCFDPQKRGNFEPQRFFSGSSVKS